MGIRSGASGLILMVGLCLGYPALTHSAPRPRLAVMEIEDGSDTISAKDIVSASEYLRGRLAASGKYIVIDRSRQAAKLKDMVKREKKASYKQCYARNCQIPLGQALSADSILRTTLSRIGGRYTVSGEIVDLAKEATVTGGFVEFKAEPAKQRVERLVEALGLVVAQLTGTYKGARKGEAARVSGVEIAEADLGKGGAGTWSAGGAPVLMNFKSEPPGAVVLINGDMSCQSTPCSRTLPSGKTRVTMHLERYESREETLDLKEGEISWSLLPNFGYLTVITQPPGLPVFVDDKELGVSPLERVEIEGGTHRVLVRSACHYEVGKRINLDKGEERELNLEAKLRPAGLQVSAKDPDGNAVNASVYVDGEEVGSAPGVFQVSVCAKSVEVRRDGMETWTDSLNLQEKETLKIEAELKTEGNENWLRISEGSFSMGSNGNLDEQPVHKVEISRPFLIQVHEMTQGEWKALVGKNPSENIRCRDCPVERITWWEALWAANRLSEKEGYETCFTLERCFGKPGRGMGCRGIEFRGVECTGYRLPTEAEWEYVVKMDPSGSLDDTAWHGDNSGGSSRSVGEKQPQAGGVFDLQGNVAEWVFDVYDAEYYGRAPGKDPVGPRGEGDERGVRGCSYASSPRRCTPAGRDKLDPGERRGDIGFRLVRSL